MKLFSKRKTVSLYAPIDGKQISITEVRDEIFSSKMMGDGVAYCEFTSDIFCAPCDGKLILVADTLHAYGIRAANGAEILIHIGLDTVMLGGVGFTQLASEGDMVKQGEPIIKLDLDILKANNIDLTTSMVITNGFAMELVDAVEYVKAGSTKVLMFT